MRRSSFTGPPSRRAPNGLPGGIKNPTPFGNLVGERLRQAGGGSSGEAFQIRLLAEHQNFRGRFRLRIPRSLDRAVCVGSSAIVTGAGKAATSAKGKPLPDLVNQQQSQSAGQPRGQIDIERVCGARAPPAKLNRDGSGFGTSTGAVQCRGSWAADQRDGRRFQFPAQAQARPPHLA